MVFVRAKVSLYEFVTLNSTYDPCICCNRITPEGNHSFMPSLPGYPFGAESGLQEHSKE